MAIACALAGALACSHKDSSPCTPGSAGVAIDSFPQTVDAFCMVSNQNGLIAPNYGVVPYDVNTPLFSDYAAKFRTVWLPPGAQVAYVADGRFELPVGTVITKSFGFPADMRQAGAPPMGGSPSAPAPKKTTKKDEDE
jgi:hypothetical protein